MSEKRFVQLGDTSIKDTLTGEEWYAPCETSLLELLNEQQATITNLKGDIERQKYIIDELKKDNYKRFEKINELQAKLKEKEQDERLYANEIVKLNKEAKEVLDFKNLGGDY